MWCTLGKRGTICAINWKLVKNESDDIEALEVLFEENNKFQKEKKNIQRELEALSIMISEEMEGTKATKYTKEIAKETLQVKVDGLFKTK